MAFVERAHGRHKAEALALVAQGATGRVHVMNCFADFHRVKSREQIRVSNSSMEE